MVSAPDRSDKDLLLTSDSVWGGTNFVDMEVVWSVDVQRLAGTVSGEVREVEVAENLHYVLAHCQAEGL